MPAFEDGVEWAEDARAALGRQKTNIVINNESEAEGIKTALERLRARQPAKGAGTANNGCVWMSNAHMRAFDRVYDELISALEEREWLGHEQTPNQIKWKCPECGKEAISKYGSRLLCMGCNEEYDEDSVDVIAIE
jgi:hypothetical protein